MRNEQSAAYEFLAGYEKSKEIGEHYSRALVELTVLYSANKNQLDVCAVVENSSTLAREVPPTVSACM
jgi:hypothetical protein